MPGIRPPAPDCHVTGLFPEAGRGLPGLGQHGHGLLAHGTSSLWYVVREWAFREAHLADMDMSIDFSRETTPEDRVAVIATQPLTDNEEWTPFAKGELMLFEKGLLKRRAMTRIG
ncbi:MAG: glutamine amidotransferase class-II family protein [Moraxellaceae bacterium]|jgi:predicted glutamine amidotransferase|nr:glutamine amidotransferase class-II family protein [Moraxellaceae bacterium]